MPPALGLLGSGEFEPWAERVDRWLIDSSATASDRVIVLPTASAPEGDDVFDRWARLGVEHYERMGVAPEVLSLKTRSDAFRPELAARLAGAGMVFFSGGNPAHLVRALHGTPFWDALLATVAGGTSLGACSAGVSMLGRLTADTAVEELRPDAWVEGMGFFPRVVFGPHWDALDRYRPGLRALVLEVYPKECAFIGIDERTAILGDGRTFRVEGLGGVSLIPPRAAGVRLARGETFRLEAPPTEYAPPA
ncbi:MAG: Type 1 glutamine amidotransferase-like domain-containing protein [Actinomycetota bacterium]